ncbi:hypothetical protein KSP40_PGU008668 [Platanthera guangdongensis]|uniref:Uncharacterized protein n=1 Tax=Platanthera guangdongensis TaxID=2320717 RepID=A0ABR2LJY0_9ASPA
MLASDLLGFVASLTSGDSDNTSPAIFLSVCGKNQTRDVEGFDVTSGFATSFSGKNLTVYGLGQCFSYLFPVNCQDYYQVGSMVVPMVSPDLMAYGMVQCWRSLNLTGCRECLEKGRAKQLIISPLFCITSLVAHRPKESCTILVLSLLTVNVKLW